MGGDLAKGSPLESQTFSGPEIATVKKDRERQLICQALNKHVAEASKCCV